MLDTRRRRSLALVVVLGLAAVGYFAWPSPASHRATLTVVGTSDVVDSNLVAAVLQPGFQAAYPNIAFHYVGQGSGAAIATAESGAASVLLVHAATLENQFVAKGYSTERFGRAVFYGDYVLLGPRSDPAGVLTHAHHDIVTAFERIAAAGAAGRANFVSRGGTPGTTVKEHSIWALATGLSTCIVSAADGGGASPSATSGACPGSVSYPGWYHATGLTQGPNVQNADVCNYTHGNCYVLTDRGTFDYLQSIHSISNLEIVTRDNSATAAGGDTLLVNSFHAYAVNPAKFASDAHVQLNVAGAKDFLNWVTSPAAQSAVGAFMSAHGDPPFLPDASPRITAAAPGQVLAGHRLSVVGTIRNVVPGTPPLAGVRLALTATSPHTPATAVATTTSDSTGHFTLRYRPAVTARYTVTSAPITQVEDAAIRPVFGDLLQPTSRSLGSSRVRGVVTLEQPTERRGKVRLNGTVKPAAHDHRARLVVLAAHADRARKSGLRRVAASPMPAGKHAYRLRVRLRPGVKWVVQVKYVDRGAIAPGRSPRREVIV